MHRSRKLCIFLLVLCRVEPVEINCLALSYCTIHFRHLEDSSGTDCINGELVNDICSCFQGSLFCQCIRSRYYGENCDHSCPGLIKGEEVLECNGNGSCDESTLTCQCENDSFDPETCSEQLYFQLQVRVQIVLV